MAVFAYNYAEMEQIVKELATISATIAESVEKIKAELVKLESQRVIAQAEYDRAYASYQKSMSSYQSSKASYEKALAAWDGKGKKPTAPSQPSPPSRATLNAIEAAIAKAQEQLKQLEADAKALEEVSNLMNQTMDMVKNAETDVLGYINTRILDLRDFSADTGVKVAKALGKGVTDSAYVQGAETKYYAALYEDYKYEDYKELAKKIGVPLTLGIMGANGWVTESGMMFMGSAGNNYSYDEVKYYMQNNVYTEYNEKINVSNAAGAGDIGILGLNAAGVVISDNIMAVYEQYKDGSDYDYTKHKTYEYYTSLTSYDQKKIQDMAYTDQTVGIRYLNVDGLIGADGKPAKVYCAAFGDIVAAAATGEPRCGDVVKVTWDDGTFDYMVVGDTKGGNFIGHTAGTWEKGYETTKSNAIELIVDRSVKTNDAINLRHQGTIGAYGIDYKDPDCVSTDNTKHWSQGFKNIEVLNINVLYN